MEKVNIDQFYVSPDDLDSYVKELYKKILNSKYYREILLRGFTNEEIMDNVTKFSDFINGLEKAEKIKTYDDCVKNDCYKRVELVRNDGIIERVFVLLKPYQDYLDYYAHFDAYDLSDEYCKSDWSNIRRDIKQSVVKNTRQNNWLYFKGEIKSGRTYTAMAVINKKYAAQNSKICVLNSYTRIKELNDAYFKDKDDFNNLMKQYVNADVLLFDDFGREYKNEFIRDTIISPIISERASLNKMTIFTSDFSLDDLMTMYSFNTKTGQIITNNIKGIIKNKIVKEIDLGVGVY